MNDLPRQLERVRFPRGTRIFREGEPGSCAYLIETGSVEISSVSQGKKIVVSTLGPGEMFGEMALIDNLKRSATATALANVELIALDRSQFESKIRVADPVLHMLLRVVLKRFRWAMRKALSHERMNITGEMQRDGDATMFVAARNEAIAQMRTEQELNEALRGRQFELYYQPIVSTRDLSIAGFEALIRWHHPDKGLLEPADFIASAEESQLISPIGDWALSQACADLARLQAMQRADAPRLFMTVNVSSRQIRHLAHNEHLARSIRDAGIRPCDLKLEITESVLIEAPELAAPALKDIRETGVRFAIDDFGTGYSSLSYLHRFPLDVLKIDRSFIAGLLEKGDSGKIVDAIMGLSRGLGIEVVAEGIESVDGLRTLIDMQCDYVQGFLMSRPVPVDQALAMIGADVDYRALLPSLRPSTAAATTG